MRHENASTFRQTPLQPARQRGVPARGRHAARRGRAGVSAIKGLVLTSALALVLGPVALPAQQLANAVDGSFGVGSGFARAAISAVHRIAVVPSRAWLGFGIRATLYSGDPRDFTNRGSQQGGLTASLTIDFPAVYGLNAAVAGDLQLVGLLGIGFNLDLIGVATGPTRRSGAIEAKPAVGSQFRYGPADRGSLNSEFFVSLAVAHGVRVRAGSSHFVLGYEVTDRSGVGVTGAPSSRYQRFFTLPFIAVSLGR